MLVGHQASSRCIQHLLVCGVRDCKAAKLPRIEFGGVSNVLCAPAPCDIWCVLVPARGSAPKPAVLAFICSATGSAAREGRAQKAAEQPGRAGHGKQQCSSAARIAGRGKQKCTGWLWRRCGFGCSLPVLLSHTASEPLLNSLWCLRGSSAWLSCFSLFTCVGRTGMALGCGQCHIPWEFWWSNWFAIPMGKKKENKMKHFAVVNGKSVAGHDLFFLFNPVPWLGISI